VPSPEELLATGHRTDDHGGAGSPFERIEIPAEVVGDAPRRAIWVRTRGQLPDDRALHACILTFISDMGPMGAIRKALGAFHQRGMGASLDHSVWFHRHVRPDEWLLFDVSSWSNHGARGLATGTLHTADGVHAASIAQEGLLRLVD
jgi:acyl-CoA thioesterase-2